MSLLLNDSRYFYTQSSPNMYTRKNRVNTALLHLNLTDI